MVSSARSRDPRLLKMRNPPNETSVSTKEHGLPSIALAPPMNSIRSLPRIPKHSNKSSSTTVTSREDRDERDPRKRRDEKTSKSDSRNRSKSSSSSTKKSSNHDSPKKRSDDEKRSSKSGHKSSKSSHSSSSSQSKSPYKNGSETTTEVSKDVDLRIIPMDVDMRPDSTTVQAAAVVASSVSPDSKLNKNQLLNDLLQDEEDMRSSQDSMISTSNGKEKMINLMMTIKMSLNFCIIIN